jgi:SNF2 family DNA or RNA helicase
LTSLGIADKMGVEHVLFLTKKKAISSIVGDYDLMCPASFILFTINYESMHKLPQNIKWDIVVIDEAHSLGAIPKPNKRAKDVKALIKKNKSKVILMSGTPTPESYSQMYHQVYGIPNNPFREYVSFYKFAKDYVDVKQRKINSMMINDYSRGLETIVDKMNPYTIRFTQKEAGFENDIVEDVLEVEMNDLTYSLTSRLKKDLVVQGKDDVILADTPVKLMMKLHQMYSGTIKFESGNSMILDLSKAQFIYDNFCVSKVGIFYKFKEELNALKKVYGDQLCTELDEFNSTDKTIALQIVSGREGISLRNAEYLVYYNIDFSATSYWQSRDRMTTKDSTLSKVYWVFAKNGIEKEIYKSVVQKKDYTLKHFKKDLLTLN